RVKGGFGGNLIVLAHDDGVGLHLLKLSGDGITELLPAAQTKRWVPMARRDPFFCELFSDPIHRWISDGCVVGQGHTEDAEDRRSPKPWPPWAPKLAIGQPGGKEIGRQNHQSEVGGRRPIWLSAVGPDADDCDDD